MRKTYLSLAMSRTWSAEMPVGDPFGGPAYGEKNGPAVALLGAFGSISMGVSIGAGTLMGGLMIAGGVMSGLGAITGNKMLSQLGMVAGLAGGVGQFFSTGGFEAYSSAFSAGDGISGGLSNMADQFMGNANYAMPGGMAPVVDATPNPVTGLGGDVTRGIMAAPPPISAPAPAPTNSARLDVDTALNSTPNALQKSVSSLQGMGSTYPNSLQPEKKGLMAGLGENANMIAGLANVAGQGLSGMANASAAADKTKAEQPLVDAKTREANATATALEQRNTIKANAAGAGAGSVGKFASNKDAGPWGVDPKTGAKRTAPEFYAYMADQWKSAYGQGVPA